MHNLKSSGADAARAVELPARDLRYLRVLGVMAASIIAALGVLHRVADPTQIDPPLERGLVVAMCLALVAVSFIYRTAGLQRLIYGGFYILTFWLLHLLFLNRLAPEYAVSLIIVIAAVGIGFRHRGALLAYSVVTFGATMLTTFSSAEPLLDPLLYAAQVGGIVILSYYMWGSRLRMQAELAQSEERFALAALASNDGWWDLHLGTGIVDLSDRCRAMLGIAAGRVVHTVDWLAALDVGDRPMLRAGLDALIAGSAENLEVEQRTLGDAQEQCWLLTRAVVVRDGAGRAHRVVGSHADITSRKRAEHTLLEQQRSMATLLSNLPGMAYRCSADRARTIEVASEGCLALTGYPAAALIGSRDVAFVDLMLPDERDRVAALVDEAVASRRPYQVEYRIRGASGEEKWLSEQGQGVFSEAGELLALEGFVNDITARKLSVEALSRRARENELLVEVFRLCALETDAPRIVQGATEALQTFFGAWSLSVYFIDDDASTLQLRGLALAKAAQAFAPLVRREWTELQLSTQHPLATAVRERRHIVGHATDDALDPVLLHFLRASGIDTFHVMPIISGNDVAGVAAFSPGAVELGPDAWRLLNLALGHVAVTIQTNRLLEIRRRTTTELRTLGAAIEQLPDAVVIFDPDFTVRSANPAWWELTGHVPEEVIGETLRHDCGAADVPALALAQGGWSGERSVCRRDGSPVPVYLSATPVWDEDGRLSAVLQIVRDLTGDKARQAEVLRVGRLSAIGELAAGVAHEVNNPLGGISMTAELLLAETLPAPMRNDIETILSEARRAGSIVRNLLAFARQEPGSKRSMDLGQVIAGVESLKRFELVAADVQLVIAVAPDARPVLANPQQLQQVLHNLLTNAQQAIAGCPGTIRIAVRAAGARTELLIDDTGPGIPERLRPRIFTPFFTTKPFGQGTGLGLAISYGIINEHGGDIVASNWGRPQVLGGDPGEGGARFTIRLPVAREIPVAPALTDAAPDAAPDAPASLAAPRVLIVDDEPVIGATLRRVLGRDGWDVDIASSAEDAIDRMRTLDYDVILSDLHMPGIGGSGLYQHLHDHADHRVDRIIFMSGDVASADTDTFLRLSGRPVLPKPFDVQRLRAVVRAVLAPAHGTALAPATGAVLAPATGAG